MSHPLFTPSSAATSRGRRLLAAVLAPIAMLALAFSISSTTAFGEVGVTQQSAEGEQALDTQDIDIEMPVRPWCGWIALTGAGTSILLEPAVGQDTTYDGDAITLEAVGQEYAIKVAPVDQATTGTLANFGVEEADACSWFADSEVNGVNVSTTLDVNTFTAVSDKNAGGATPDDTMDFATDDDVAQNLVIDNTPATCDDTLFSFINNPFVVTTSASATTGTNVVSLDAMSTTTNSYCSWTSDYTVTIPSGLMPMFGSSTYTYTGPTITNTMVYGRP
jgi:hypothetical protein